MPPAASGGAATTLARAGIDDRVDRVCGTKDRGRGRGRGDTMRCKDKVVVIGLAKRDVWDSRIGGRKAWKEEKGLCW